jgi:hypothetical protein
VVGVFSLKLKYPDRYFSLLLLKTDEPPRSYDGTPISCVTAPAAAFVAAIVAGDVKAPDVL